ncbi:MAG: hypothetical protein P4N41_10655 [Negativicutes bacterium]|nr:hypothetical protein [Negativicutes bacterium]
MEKFTCGCGRSVRDVYYKNGGYMCVKCFWQGCESPFDYLITLLASRGLVITYKNEPVLILKQFSADCLADRETVVRPNKEWLWISGDEFWMNYTGKPEQLRDYITNYSVAAEDGCCAKED